ncbi:MAG TPA: hypothetical protein VGG01_02280 [Xanthobacteraceae bacterium]|jgi:hypothetical protein
MRRVVVGFAMVVALAVLGAPAQAAPPKSGVLQVGAFTSREAVLGWMNQYRAHRDPAHVPDAVHAMSQLGVFKDPENAGAFIGFIAGVLRDNAAQVDRLLDRMLPLPPEDQWALVQAVAYSEMPGWKDVLYRYRARMPTRQLMIEKYVMGELPTLRQAGFEQAPGTFDKIGGWFGLGDKDKKKVALEPSPALLDTLWGYYCATGSFNPAISDIIALLTWSKDRNDVDKLTLGGMAKYTLAANASRDARLLAMLKSVAKYYPTDVKKELDEVTLAAETMDLAKLRKDALASIAELKRKGPGYKREVSMWGQIGEGALALGCIGAAAAGQIEFGIPCVVTGAVSSAGLHYFDSQ